MARIKLSDPAWKAFETVLRARDVRPAALADLLFDIDSVTISNWKRGAARPRLSELSRISQAIGEGPNFLAEVMGIVTTEGALSKDLDELSTRVVRLQEIETGLATRVGSRVDESVGKLVAAVTHTAEWAVAVWPAVEGPADCRIHVADRIDIRRTDGRLVRASDVRQAFGPWLERCHAVVGRSLPRWDETPTSGIELSPVSHWSAPRFDIEFGPVPSAKGHLLRSIALTALTISSGVGRTGAILARVLGYGNTSSSKQHTRSFGGGPVTARTRIERAHLNRRWHNEPTSLHVWTHFGRFAEGNSPWPPELPGGLTVVWLRESTEVLHSGASTRSAELVADLDRCKSELDELAATAGPAINVVDVEDILQGEHMGDLKMERALGVSLAILIQLINQGLVDRRVLQARLATLGLGSRADRELAKWFTAQAYL